MILCSCNVLSSADLKATAERLRAGNPSIPVTPGRVFLALGVRPQCGSCIDLVRRMLRDWGFPATCPEPLASIAADESGGKSAKTEEEWDMV